MVEQVIVGLLQITAFLRIFLICAQKRMHFLDLITMLPKYFLQFFLDLKSYLLLLRQFNMLLLKPHCISYISNHDDQVVLPVNLDLSLCQDHCAKCVMQLDVKHG